jgi:hypothetical protein
VRGSSHAGSVNCPDVYIVGTNRLGFPNKGEERLIDRFYRSGYSTILHDQNVKILLIPSAKFLARAL